MSISVITPTNRHTNINTILNNFLRQSYNPKELIILLNFDFPDQDLWNNIVSKHDNISVYYMGAKLSLGACLNYGISKSKYDYIAKLDDDDYYGEDYLKESVLTLENVNTDIIGKSTIYIYFCDDDVLGIKHINYENKFVNRVEGSTLFFNKEITNIIKFRDKILGEDIDFCRDAIEKNLKIYSSNKNQYVYIRGNKNNHTWKVNNYYLIRECVNVGNKSDLDELFIKWKK